MFAIEKVLTLTSGKDTSYEATKDGYYCVQANNTSAGECTAIAYSGGSIFYSVAYSRETAYAHAQTEWLYFKTGEKFNCIAVGTSSCGVWYASPRS